MHTGSVHHFYQASLSDVTTHIHHNGWVRLRFIAVTLSSLFRVNIWCLFWIRGLRSELWCQKNARIIFSFLPLLVFNICFIKAMIMSKTNVNRAWITLSLVKWFIDEFFACPCWVFFRSKLGLFQSRISLQKASVKVRHKHNTVIPSSDRDFTVLNHDTKTKMVVSAGFSNEPRTSKKRDSCSPHCLRPQSVTVMQYCIIVCLSFVPVKS